MNRYDIALGKPAPPEPRQPRIIEADDRGTPEMRVVARPHRLTPQERREQSRLRAQDESVQTIERMREGLRRGQRMPEAAQDIQAMHGIDLSQVFVHEMTPETEQELRDQMNQVEEERAEQEQNQVNITPTTNEGILADLWSAPPDVSRHFQ